MAVMSYLFHYFIRIKEMCVEGRNTLQPFFLGRLPQTDRGLKREDKAGRGFSF